MRELAAALAAMLPQAGIGWADQETTAPADLPLGATPQRRAEFAAGRIAAMAGMQALGLPAAAVPMGADRAPLWPNGLTGSITHTRTVCLAAVARGGCIGIDLELENAVGPDLWDEILTLNERLAVEADPALATIIFCAKEAIYKAQYPATRQLFGFDRLQITLGTSDFTARFTAQTGPLAAGSLWTGRFSRCAGHVLAAIHRA